MTCDTYLPRLGGAEVHVYELKRALESRGHNIILYTTEPGTQEETVIRNPWQHNWLSQLYYLWKLSKSVDIIHAHYAYRLAFLGGIVAKLRGIPLYITEHGYGILNHPGTPFLFHCVHAFYRYWSLQFARVYISTSEDLAIPARNYISDKKIVVVPNGVSYAIFRDAQPMQLPDTIPAHAKIMLTVRRLTGKCGIQYLAAAFPQIVAREPDIHWIMIGDGPYREEIITYLKTHGVYEKVTMLGVVPNDQVPSYYAHADVVVFPSTAESTSISCIEAMAAGCAVVASAVGGLVELIGRDGSRGTLVKLFDHTLSDYTAPPVESIPSERITALVQAVVEKLQDTQRAQSVGRVAQNFAEQYDWSHIADQIISIYEQREL